MLALHLPPLYSCPSSTHTREREGGRSRKERYLGERATYTLTYAPLKGSKPSAHPSLSLPPSAPQHVSPFLPRLSLSSHSRAHTHTLTHGGLGGARAARHVLSLSLSTHARVHASGGISPLLGWHVHAAMLTRASSAVLSPALTLPYLPQVHQSAPAEQPARDDLHRPDASSVRREGRERGAENEGGCRRWEPAGIREREGGVRTADDAYVSVRVCAYVLSYSLPSPVSPTLCPPSLLSLPPPPPPLLPLQHP